MNNKTGTIAHLQRFVSARTIKEDFVHWKGCSNVQGPIQYSERQSNEITVNIRHTPVISTSTHWERRSDNPTSWRLGEVVIDRRSAAPTPAIYSRALISLARRGCINIACM